MIHTAIIYQPDFQKAQAVFFKAFETESGKLDIEVSTPIYINTNMRDIEIDLQVALEESGIREKINEISTVTKLPR